jgi:four helix bundle protein
VLGNQLLRCGTSVGANYRAACRGRTTAEFVAKLGIVLEEADESGFWIELIVEGGLLPEERCAELHKEADEICVIIFSMIRSTRDASAR